VSSFEALTLFVFPVPTLTGSKQIRALVEIVDETDRKGPISLATPYRDKKHPYGGKSRFISNGLLQFIRR
jgi:hypothetical protein